MNAFIRTERLNINGFIRIERLNMNAFVRIERFIINTYLIAQELKKIAKEPFPFLMLF